jgi:hypothetical protein
MERADAELRAAVSIAGTRIAKVNFGRRSDAVPILRRVLRESRQVHRRARRKRRITYK